MKVNKVDNNSRIGPEPLLSLECLCGFNFQIDLNRSPSTQIKKCGSIHGTCFKCNKAYILQPKEIA